MRLAGMLELVEGLQIAAAASLLAVLMWARMVRRAIAGCAVVQGIPCAT